MSQATARHTYTPVPSNASERVSDNHRRARRSAMDTVSNKLHALLWVLAAAAVVIFTDVPRITFTDERISQVWLIIALCASGMAAACALYLTVYLPYIARVYAAWEVYCPNVVPMATLSSLAAFLAFSIAIWPVYGLLTVPLLSVLCVGGLMAFHFVPAW